MSEPIPELPELDAWATLDDVRDSWASAPLDDALLIRMLNAAHIACVAYAPPLAEGTAPPANYVEAECLQTRAIGNAHDRDGDVIGFGAEGYAIRVRPLGADVKALLRPRVAAPKVR